MSPALSAFRQAGLVAQGKTGFLCSGELPFRKLGIISDSGAFGKVTGVNSLLTIPGPMVENDTPVGREIRFSSTSSFERAAIR